MNKENLKDELKPFYEKGDCCSWIVELRKDKYQLQKENKQLKEIINNAIDYINKNKQIVSNLKCSAGCSLNEEPKEYNVYKLYCEPTELLEILGDKEKEGE